MKHRIRVPVGVAYGSDAALALKILSDTVADDKRVLKETIDSLKAANLELKKAQNDVIRAEKLATVGRLTAGIAHEIGNPLGAVVGYLNILKDDLSGESRDMVQRSLAETERIDRLVRERDAQGAFESLDDLIERTPVSMEQIAILIKIDAFRFTGADAVHAERSAR